MWAVPHAQWLQLPLVASCMPVGQFPQPRRLRADGRASSEAFACGGQDPAGAPGTRAAKAASKNM